MFYKLRRLYFKIPSVIRLLLTIFAFMFIFGYIVHLLEPNNFKTVFDGIWWAFITGSTVGYGDLVPETFAGRMMGILLLLFGGGVLTFYMVTFSKSTISRARAYSEGKINFKGKNHCIIVGWNERSRNLIEMIHQQEKEKTAIVLIDSSLTEDPINLPYVHFIRHDPTTDDTWLKANISFAKSIIVTSDPSKSEIEADTYSVLITITARGFNQDIPIFVEIITEQQKINAFRAGATEVIYTMEAVSTLFFHELTSDTPMISYEYVVELLSQQRFLVEEVKSEWLEMSIVEFILKMKKDKGLLMLGIIRGEDIYLNPLKDKTLAPNDLIIFSKS